MDCIFQLHTEEGILINGKLSEFRKMGVSTHHFFPTRHTQTGDVTDSDLLVSGTVVGTSLPGQDLGRWGNGILPQDPIPTVTPERRRGSSKEEE